MLCLMSVFFMVMLFCSHSNIHSGEHRKYKCLQKGHQQFYHINENRKWNRDGRSENTFEYEDQTNQT